MDTHEILGYLEAQRDAIDHALKALGASNGTRPKFRRSGKKTMSAAARKRISRAQKKRWREMKAKGKA